MWCTAVTVDVTTATADSQREGLEREVVPAVSTRPGFVRGTWALRDDGRAGIGFLVFEDEQSARAAADDLEVGGPAGAGATVSSVHVYEVLAQAARPQLVSS